MATSLVSIEAELHSRMPAFAEVLPPGLAPARLVRTVLISLERTPKLLQCTPQSIINSALTAATLGLEVDGVTGQGFLIPYAGVCTFQLGYKGYPTIAARSGMSISMGVSREGDEFDYRKGTGAFVNHKPALVGRANRKIIAGYAVAEAHDRPPIVDVMPYDDILAIKERSRGAAKEDSPWNDYNGPGHEAMCAKTVCRRLGRGIPIVGFQRANAMEAQHDMGRAAYIDREGNITTLDGDASPYPDRGKPVDDLPVTNLNERRRTAKEELAYVETLTRDEAALWERDNADRLSVMKGRYPDAYARFRAVLDAKQKAQS